MGGLCGLEKQACTSWPPWWHACCFLRLGSVSLIFNNVFFFKVFLLYLIKYTDYYVQETPLIMLLYNDR
jgi:hypothetical protein